MNAERIGRFLIRERIGSGGTGVVHRAFDEKLRRDVALKIFDPELVADATRRARFLREARAAAALSHPNIRAVHEVGEEGDLVYIVLEHVSGRSLRDRLRQGPMRPEEALKIAHDVARALAEAHAAGIVHRDVKPENVLIGDDGRAKLADFGLAKILAADARVDAAGAGAEVDTIPAVTRDGALLGTPGYMSPEQATGRAVDARSDVFSFGVVLHEMLVGKAPFSAATPMESVAAIVRDVPPPPSAMSRSVPEPLDRIVVRCLEKAADARYEDGRALAADLDALVRGGIALAARPRMPMRAIAWIGGTIVTVAIVTLVVRQTEPSGSAPSAAPAASSAAAIVETLPAGWFDPPRNCSDAAVRELRAGVSDIRTGRWARAHDRFGAARAADATCPEAALRRTITGYFYDSPANEREAYREAVKLRDGLTPRDRELLDAYEPLLARDPGDDGEHVARLVALAERRPEDVELVGGAAFALARQFRDWEGAATLARRALAKDPGFADGWQVLGRSLLRGKEDRAGAIAAFDECIRVAPHGIDCLQERIVIEIADGECARMEASAREMVARDPSAESGHWHLALALASQGAPRAAVEDALRDRAALLTEAYRPARPMLDRARVAAAYGEFDEAEARLAELEPVLAGDATFGLHAEWALLGATMALETRRPERARAIAAAFAGKRRALTGNTYSYAGHVASYHAEPFLLSLRAAAENIRPEVIEREQKTWVAWVRDVRNFDARGIWAYTDATFVRDAASAKQAVSAMPAGLDPMALTAIGNLATGRTLMLAGRAREAMPWLRAAVGSCRSLEEPFVRGAARVALGRALEAIGERASACEQYGAVVEMWASAKAKSASVAEATESSKRLACR